MVVGTNLPGQEYLRPASMEHKPLYNNNLQTTHRPVSPANSSQPTHGERLDLNATPSISDIFWSLIALKVAVLIPSGGSKESKHNTLPHLFTHFRRRP